MPRITIRGSRIDARRATTVGLASFATLTLVPLLAHAKPSERAVLLLAAVPAAALFGYLAGYAAGSAAGSAATLEATELQAAQLSRLQVRAAQLQAAQPSAPVISIVSEPVPQPGTGSPVGSGHLAALARPPADQPASRSARQQRDGLHLVPAPSRGTSTTRGPAGDAGSSRISSSDPHFTLIATQHPSS
ncbi:hypothetical protein ACFQ46_02255 [Kineococcus sp. GCM10028916]|uniref:hypothetical protein n=1 Tax=Kineococcus sp. GCM10028916 TaxID=3273394 RepID=UPI003627E7BF